MSQTMSQSAGVKPYEEGGDLHQHDAFVKSGNSVLWDVGLCPWRVGRVRRAVVRGPRGRASPSLARSVAFCSAQVPQWSVHTETGPGSGTGIRFSRFTFSRPCRL
jgi:hypothetical protein